MPNRAPDGRFCSEPLAAWMRKFLHCFNYTDALREVVRLFDRQSARCLCLAAEDIEEGHYAEAQWVLESSRKWEQRREILLEAIAKLEQI